jgi:putative peptidoglycan lipid II flippase
MGFRWHLRFDWNHAAVRRLGKLALWVAVYVVANQVAYVIIIILTGNFPPGGYQIYASAFILFQLPYAIFAVSIFTALLPGMSGRWTDREPAGVLRLFSRGIRDTAVIIVPAAFGYIALALPIVQLLLEHGHAGPQDAEQIARTLQAFAVGLPFFSAFQLLTRTFYATQDTRTPALVNVAAAGVNVGADLLYVYGFGWHVPGLALGHATSYVFGTAVCLFLLRRRLGSIDGRHVLRTTLRIIPVSLLAAGSAWLVSQGLHRALGPSIGTVGELVQVTAAIAVGLLVFVASALILRIEEADEVKDAVLRRFRG